MPFILDVLFQLPLLPLMGQIGLRITAIGSKQFWKAKKWLDNCNWLRTIMESEEVVAFEEIIATCLLVEMILLMPYDGAVGDSNPSWGGGGGDLGF